MWEGSKTVCSPYDRVSPVTPGPINAAAPPQALHEPRVRMHSSIGQHRVSSAGFVQEQSGGDGDARARGYQGCLTGHRAHALQALSEIHTAVPRVSRTAAT